MISPVLRFFFAISAWLLAVFFAVTQDHHGGQLFVMLSILFALVAVVPRAELSLKVNSKTLWAADFLACAFLLVLVLGVVVGVIHICLKFYGAL